MAIIETAIMDYYVLHKHLPCPAEGRALEMDSNFGFSEPYDPTTRECMGNLVGNTGMVPVRTLKIPEEYAYDGWGRKFSYRIAKGILFIQKLLECLLSYLKSKHALMLIV